MNAYVLYSLHQPWFIFCLVLKFALQLLYSWVEMPHLPSWRPPSLSLSLSLVSSHSLCLIGSVISPHSAWCLLIWQRDCLPDHCCCLYCLVLHLTNSSKGKEREWEKIAENQAVLHNWLCKSACQKSLSSNGARNVCLLMRCCTYIIFSAINCGGRHTQPLTAVRRSIRTGYHFYEY